jgi:hypothetical protein
MLWLHTKTIVVIDRQINKKFHVSLCLSENNLYASNKESSPNSVLIKMFYCRRSLLDTSVQKLSLNCKFK